LLLRPDQAGDLIAGRGPGQWPAITASVRTLRLIRQADDIWHQTGSGKTETLVAALRESARRNPRSLQREVRSILAAAEADESPAALPPIQLKTVRTTASSRWSRAEIYDDEGR
jgi:hypothetical protein